MTVGMATGSAERVCEEGIRAVRQRRGKGGGTRWGCPWGGLGNLQHKIGADSWHAVTGEKPVATRCVILVVDIHTEVVPMGVSTEGTAELPICRHHLKMRE
jgi:hypothetical protein